MALDDAAAAPSAALSLQELPGLGETYVATRDILAGELLLRERAQLIATNVSDLSDDTRAEYEDASTSLSSPSIDVGVEELCVVHAFARAPEEVRTRLLTANCGAEACDTPEHHLVQSASRKRRNDRLLEARRSTDCRSERGHF